MSSFPFCMQANSASKKSYSSTPRERQSVPSVGYMDCTQDAEEAFSPTGSSCLLRTIYAIGKQIQKSEFL